MIGAVNEQKMNVKKIILYVTGPGAILYLGVVLYIHIFLGKNMIFWIIPALVILCVVFFPLFVIEKFRHNDQKSRERNPNIRFQEKNSRIEWRDGNIHGKVPRKTKGPDFPGKDEK